MPRANIATSDGTSDVCYVPAGSLGALREQQETQPSGASIVLAYDALGRVSSRTVSGSGAETFQYDALGRLVGHDSDLGSFTLGYLGETAQLTSRALSGTTLATTWSYLPNSGDRRLSGISSVGLASGQTSSFTYTSNDLGWITSSTESSDTATVYPSQEQRIGLANNLNQITLRNGQNLTYDADGHMLSDGTRTYSWDAAGRLIRVTYPGQPGKSTSFTYDGLGRRVAIANTVGSTTTTLDYVWCQLRLCQARTPTGTVARECLAEGEYSPGSPATGEYYAQDPVGTVRRVYVSSTEAPAYAYDPYGQALQATAPTTDFNYAGMFHEAGSGLDLTLARAYDPQAGRWLSRDPLGEGTDPYGNLYAYVAGNPVTNADPLGLDIGRSAAPSLAPPDLPLEPALPPLANNGSGGPGAANCGGSGGANAGPGAGSAEASNPSSLSPPEEEAGNLTNFIRACGIICGLLSHQPGQIGSAIGNGPGPVPPPQPPTEAPMGGAAPPPPWPKEP